MKLTDNQRAKLQQLVRDGEIWSGCTNPTLCALEKRGLADWEGIRGRAFERWFPTAAGISAITKEPTHD